MKKLKKILSLFLVSIILLPTLVVGVQAEGPEKIYFKFIYNNYIPTKFLSGGNHEDVSLDTDDHWHGFQKTKRNEFDIPIEASANSGHKTISIFISQRKGTKISATLTSGNESKTFTIDSPKEKDIKLGKAMLKFEVYYGDTLHFMENRNEPNYVPFTEDLTVQVDFEIVNFEEFRQSYIDELHRTYSYPEKESLYEEGLKSAIKTAEKEFREAKNQEDIMKAAKKFFKFTTEDYEEQVAKWSDRRSQLSDKVYKKKSDGTYLFSEEMRNKLMDNAPMYSSIYNSYSKYYDKSFSDSMAEFDPYEKKVDVIVKKAEIKEKLKDHDENYEPIFTQEQKEEFERKIDAINDDDADAMEKLAKIEKDVDTIRDAKNATQEEKDAAKEEIGNLPNLSDDEKDKYKKQVDDAQTKGDVEKAVEDAKAKSGVPAPEPSPTPNPSVDRDHDYWYRPYWTYSYGTSNTTKQKPVKTNLVKLESKLVIGSKEMVKSVDGVEQKINMDIAPFIEGNRTMLPIRFVAESLGFNVQWDKESRTVILIDKENVVKIPVDTNQIIVNGKVYESDVKPVIRNNRTMLPIANIARALGLKDGTDIIWNAATKEVKINREIEK